MKAALAAGVVGVAGIAGIATAAGAAAARATGTGHGGVVTVWGGDAVRGTISRRRGCLELDAPKRPRQGWFAVYEARVARTGVYRLEATATVPVEHPRTARIGSYVAVGVNGEACQEVAHAQPHWYESPHAGGALCRAVWRDVELRRGMNTFRPDLRLRGRTRAHGHRGLVGRARRRGVRGPGGDGACGGVRHRGGRVRTAHSTGVLKVRLSDDPLYLVAEGDAHGADGEGKLVSRSAAAEPSHSAASARLTAADRIVLDQRWPRRNAAPGKDNGDAPPPYGYRLDRTTRMTLEIYNFGTRAQHVVARARPDAAWEVTG